MKIYIKPARPLVNIFALTILIAFILGLIVGKANAQKLHNGKVLEKASNPQLASRIFN